MKNFKGILLLVAIFASYGISAVPMQFGAPVPTIQGNNYRQFAASYKGYLINQNNQVDPQWVAGAIAALQQDGLYNSNNFLNVLWSDIEGLVNYYAQGNQAFKNATQQSLVNVYNNVAGRAMQVQQPVQAPRQVQLPTVSFSLRSIMDGALGSVYASKVKEIYSYDGTVAARRGDPALMGKLQNAIQDANTNPSPEGKIYQLKMEIDNIYNLLMQYRLKDTIAKNTSTPARLLPQIPSVPVERQTSYVQRPSVSATVTQFIEDSRRQGIVGVKKLSIDWLSNAVGAVLNGQALTQQNKSFVQDQLMKIVDAITMAALRDDKSITDEEYDTRKNDFETQVIDFMAKLKIGARYSYR